MKFYALVLLHGCYWRVIHGNGSTKNGEHPQNEFFYDSLDSVSNKIDECMRSGRPICCSERVKYVRIFHVFLDVHELQIAVKTFLRSQ